MHQVSSFGLVNLSSVVDLLDIITLGDNIVLPTRNKMKMEKKSEDAHFPGTRGAVQPVPQPGARTELQPSTCVFNDSDSKQTISHE